MATGRIARCVASCVMAVSVAAEQPVLTGHDMTVQPWIDLNPSIRIRKVMGEVGTFAIVEFKAGLKSGGRHT